MKIGLIGLGKMGGNMALRLAVGSPDGSVAGGHSVVGYDPHPNPDLAGVKGIEVVDSLARVVEILAPPRLIWVMVPAGEPTESTIKELMDRLSAGDCLIDGGNSYYKDSLRRAQAVGEKGIGYLDVGTSGGIWGRQEGYCMMIGGERADVERAGPILDTLAPHPAADSPTAPGGWAHVGPAGAGHFVKMIHNGIEYGLMEAYGEGFEILRKARFTPAAAEGDVPPKEVGLDLHQIAAVWNKGSVIRSWLLELAERMFSVENDLRTIQPYVEDSGEGRWTLQAAIDEEVPAPVIAASLFARFNSRDPENFSARFCAALRKQFGGHNVIRSDLTTKSPTRQVNPHRP